MYGRRTQIITTVLILLILSMLGCVGPERLDWSLERSEGWVAGAPLAIRSVEVEDVDGDGVPELLTGGDLHTDAWYTRGSTTIQGIDHQGQLRVWHWTGSTLTLAHQAAWARAGVWSVGVGDLDDDGISEIVTGGWTQIIGTGGLHGELRIWHWTGSTLTLVHREVWATGDSTVVRSVEVEDVDGDGIPELLTGGWTRNRLGVKGELRIWHWTGSTLTLIHREVWVTGTTTVVYSLRVGDIDGDGVPELLTGGIARRGSHAYGQLRVWHWTGSTLTLAHSEVWSRATEQLIGLLSQGTVVWSVEIEDVDGDGIPELLTGARVHDGLRVNGQLRIWYWTGTTLTLAHSEEWATGSDTTVWSVGVGDVDDDGIPELFTGGFIDKRGSIKGELRIWHWTGSTLTSVHREVWTTGDDTAVWLVGVGDVDGDGVPELFTSGMVGGFDRGIILGNQPPPEFTPPKNQLRIWYWAGSTLTLAYSEEWETFLQMEM